MKVFLQSEADTIHNIVRFRPFSYGPCTLVDNPEDAEIILGRSLFDSSPMFEKHEEKFLFALDDDNPSKAYLTKAICLVGQPIPSATHEQHLKARCIPMPMLNPEAETFYRSSPNLVREYRRKERKYNYTFHGDLSTNPGCRNFLDTLRLPKFDYNSTKHRYGQANRKSAVERQLEFGEYMSALADATFCFCPRGAGSSSYRVYEALMVGTIPIITDKIDYPFDRDVAWDGFAVRGSRDQDFNFLLNLPIEQMREGGARFYDEYVNPVLGYPRLIEKVREMLQ